VTAATHETEPDAAEGHEGTHRVLALARAHWLFLVLLVTGTTMRALVQYTYWPAEFNADSHTYFRAAMTHKLDTIRPSGYGLTISLVPWWERLWTITALQHLLGLLLATAMYLFLLRWRVPRWGAALACAAVLLDPMQVVMEQFVLSDFLAEVGILAACLLLLWRRPGYGVWACLGTGALLGASSSVRSVASPLILLVAVAVLVGARQRARSLLALVVGFALLLGPYVVEYDRQHGELATSGYTPYFLYARTAMYADCRSLELPAYERSLCPYDQVASEVTTNSAVWNVGSPSRSLVPPPGKTQQEVLSDFNRRVLRQQPGRYLRVVLRDTLRGFAPTRAIGHDNVFDRQWQPDRTLHANVATTEARQLVAGGLRPRLHRATLSLTAAYGHLYVPGPVFLLALLVALAVAAGAVRSRRSRERRLAAGLLALVALAAVVIPAATASFSWRYQLTQLCLLPLAAAIALTRERAPEEDAA
jgi:hypothetical protein